MKNLHRIVLSGLLAGILVFSGGQAFASLSLSFNDGVDPILTFTDSATPGHISQSFVLGPFTVNLVGMVNLPGPSPVGFDLSSINVTTSTSGTLIISARDSGLSLPGSILSLTAVDTGQAIPTGNATESSVVFLSGAGPFPALTGFNANFHTTAGFSNTFTLGEDITLTLSSGTTTSIDNSVTASPIPEPGTLMLLGSGLIGFAVPRIRKFRGADM